MLSERAMKLKREVKKEKSKLVNLLINELCRARDRYQWNIMACLPETNVLETELLLTKVFESVYSDL